MQGWFSEKTAQARVQRISHLRFLESLSNSAISSVFGFELFCQPCQGSDVVPIGRSIKSITSVHATPDRFWGDLHCALLSRGAR